MLLIVKKFQKLRNKAAVIKFPWNKNCLQIFSRIYFRNSLQNL